MKTLLTTLLLGIVIGLWGQSINLDSIDFDDQSIFIRKINRKANDKIDFVEYKQKEGKLKKILFYDVQQRIKKEQIWNEELIQETAFTYFEKGQIIKRFDVINQTELTPLVNVHIKYPVMARENQIEGIVEISLKFNEDCIPIAYEILNNLGHGINKEVAKKMNLIIQLSQKYKIPYEECHETNENFKLDFKLE